MGTSVVFDLIGTLVTRFDAAVTANVYDGFGVTDDPGNYLMVGVEDPDSDRGIAAEARQDWAAIGNRARYEEGTVTCVAMAWNGDGDLAAARTACKAITVEAENHLRSDPNLGGTVTGLMWTGYGTRTQLIPIQAEDGACVICVFDVAFKARI